MAIPVFIAYALSLIFVTCVDYLFYLGSLNTDFGDSYDFEVTQMHKIFSILLLVILLLHLTVTGWLLFVRRFKAAFIISIIISIAALSPVVLMYFF